MNSHEIITQYLCGSLPRKDARASLEDIIRKERYPETAKARYCTGFITRYEQYHSGKVTTDELLMSLRDLILFTGKISVPDDIINIVRSQGGIHNIIEESNRTVTAVMTLPKWFHDDSFTKNVYTLENAEERAECSSPGDKLLTINTVFNNYKSFEQKIAVYTSLLLPDGYTLMVSLPTGGGKSLITQMLAATREGLTLVIVPTVALAIDQYNAAITSLTSDVRRNVYCYRSGQEKSNYQNILNSIRNKTARLLFTSPEAILKNTMFKQALLECAKERYLCNLIFDEAHLIPDWGVFFRPEFQILSIVAKEWRARSGNYLRTYLLSATLSDEVVSALFMLYGQVGRCAEVRCDALRKEPRFCFCPAKDHTEQDNMVLELVKTLPKPMVIYVLEPDEAVRTKTLLKGMGLKNVPVFTGKTLDNDRDYILENWKTQSYDVIVATSAFGIGVDKPDVRTIVHKCVPENLSRFYQEVGRGGRDGLPSLSVLVPYVGKSDGEGDLKKAFGLVNKRVLRVEKMVIRWFSMLRSERSELLGDVVTLDSATPPTTFDDEEVEHAGNQNIAWNVNLLLFLYRTGFIDIQEVYYQPEKQSYFFKIRILKLDEMQTEESFDRALQTVRQKEFEGQVEGYYLIRQLVQNPESQCWGAVLKKLYPLAAERCNGCPKNKNLHASYEKRFKIRTNPTIILSPPERSAKLKRRMGRYSRIVLRNPQNEGYDLQDINRACELMGGAGIGCLVLPEQLIGNVDFTGVLFTYEEFCFCAEHCPYLFVSGVMCIFNDDVEQNDRLFQWLESLEEYGYSRVYYCNEHMRIQSRRRNLLDFIDCYATDSQSL